MLTSSWSNYRGPGRIALSPVPPSTPRGYRLAPRRLRLLGPASPVQVRAILADLDARLLFAELHQLAYPWAPVLMGAAAEPVCTYRRIIADWLSTATDEPISEMKDATMHRPQYAGHRWRRCFRPKSAA